MHDTSRVRVHVIGPFQLFGSDGIDRTPRGRKSCAVIALLALSPECQRSRKWLQQRLWSDRAPQQGAASLRQCLVELRRILDSDRDVLRADNFHLSLDRERVEIDLDLFQQGELHAVPKDAELLEGVDVNDPEFEGWLREQRQHFDFRQFEFRRFDFPHLDFRQSVQSEVGHSAFRRNAAAKHAPPVGQSPYLILNHAPRSDANQTDILADCLLDAVATTATETGTLRVIDGRDGYSEAGAAIHQDAEGAIEPLVLRAQTLKDPGKSALRILLKKAASHEIVWSTAAQDKSGDEFHFGSEAFLRQTNHIASLATNALVNALPKKAQSEIASAVCYRGAVSLFKLGGANFQLADRLFARAFELEPKGVYLGWRAYARTFMLAERSFVCRQSVAEEAMDFIGRALELDPCNSYISGFAAQVHNIINRCYVSAYEFAERSVELNRSNPVGWSQLGAAKCHLGEIESGFEDTCFALRISGAAPYRFQLAGISCIAGAMAGQVDRAVSVGEASHALAPSFGPPMRYLSVLYLHQGDEAKSIEMVERLRVAEPDFDYDSLKDPSYPAAGLNVSGLLSIVPARQI
ncbi:MAG: hypothetical protein AAGC70_17430 [Pseudomonadota bacterium]